MSKLALEQSRLATVRREKRYAEAANKREIERAKKEEREPELVDVPEFDEDAFVKTSEELKKTMQEKVASAKARNVVLGRVLTLLEVEGNLEKLEKLLADA